MLANRIIGAQSGDPYWSNVVALLHMDGTDGSTTFIDERGHTFTANGNAQIDTAQSQFGGASGLFDGTGDYITTPDSADWDFGTGDFTVEFFVRFNALPTSDAHTIVGNYVSGTTGWYVQFRNDAPGARLTFGSSGDSPQNDFTWSPSLATWYHVAVSRAVGTARAFVDGGQIGADVTNAENISGSTGVLMVGALNLGPIQYLNGWLDELRITKGVARYTSSFTPPSGPFPAG
ncbi:MAG: LamG domain-containing protein [Gammaproteobacteria bacterium]